MRITTDVSHNGKLLETATTFFDPDNRDDMQRSVGVCVSHGIDAIRKRGLHARECEFKLTFTGE